MMKKTTAMMKMVLETGKELRRDQKVFFLNVSYKIILKLLLIIGDSRYGDESDETTDSSGDSDEDDGEDRSVFDDTSSSDAWSEPDEDSEEEDKEEDEDDDGEMDVKCPMLVNKSDKKKNSSQKNGKKPAKEDYDSSIFLFTF